MSDSTLTVDEPRFLEGAGENVEIHWKCAARRCHAPERDFVAGTAGLIRPAGLLTMRACVFTT